MPGLYSDFCSDVEKLWIPEHCIFATIIGFDKSLYEAAVVDGASAWQQIKKITLPLLETNGHHIGYYVAWENVFY